MPSTSTTSQYEKAIFQLLLGHTKLGCAVIRFVNLKAQICGYVYPTENIKQSLFICKMTAIELVSVDNNALIFNVDGKIYLSFFLKFRLMVYPISDYMKIRCEHRIVGKLVGFSKWPRNPNYPGKNVLRTFPYFLLLIVTFVFQKACRQSFPRTKLSCSSTKELRNCIEKI